MPRIKPKATGFCDILEWYEKEDFIVVPGYYDKEKSHYCHICGWENRDSARTCLACHRRYGEAVNAGKSIQGIRVVDMGMHGFLVFQAISAQMQRGEKPYATLEEYAAEVRRRNEQLQKEYREEYQKRQQFDAVYDA